MPEIELRGREGTLDNSLDLFMLALNGFVLRYNRSADLNSSFKIEVDSALLAGYQYGLEGNHSDLLGPEADKLARPKVHELIEFKSKEQGHPCLDVTIKMKTTGEKIIEMNI